MDDCKCGRSPTGKCLGWHNLTASQYQSTKVIWLAKRKAETLAEEHSGLFQILNQEK